LRPSTTLCLKIDGEVIEEHAQGDDNLMLMNALAKIYKSKELQLPKLIDYAVRIPPGSSSDDVKPLLLGLIMEKNLKLEDWILIKQ
jgi:D-citramalate synthase